MGDHVDQSVLARLAVHEYKLVLYNQVRRSPAPNIITVNNDNFRCGRLAGEALVNQGHRRIGLITGEINKITVQDRLDGFETALTCAGIPFDREKYLEHGAFNRRSGGYDAAMTLPQRNKDNLPTALCAASASMLMGRFSAICDCGLRVPEDISSSASTRWIWPCTPRRRCLSWLHPANPPPKETVQRLIELVEIGNASQRDYVIPDVELYMRESVLRINT